MTKKVYYFRSSPAERLLRKLPRSYRREVLDRAALPDKWSLPAVLVTDVSADGFQSLNGKIPAGEQLHIICLTPSSSSRKPALPNKPYLALLPKPVRAPALVKALKTAFQNMAEIEERRRMRRELVRTRSELETLNRIGVAMATERDTEALLNLILTKGRELTNADAGSLYLAEGRTEGSPERLVFKLTQNHSCTVPIREFSIPLDRASLAGYCAAEGVIVHINNAYRIHGQPYSFNPNFDLEFGYRTKSVLVVPMKNQKEEVIGVIQLINAKRRRGVRLNPDKNIDREVIPFSKRSRGLAAALAGQAAVALENNLLYQNIQHLFEGFIKASVKAIEFRDPTTFGHSERVARLTVGLAQAVNRTEVGRYREINFGPQDVQEIRYAALLHDIGKVGVREEVLVKAKKLYPQQLTLVRKRFQYIRKAIESENYRRQLNYVVQHGKEAWEQVREKYDAACGEQFRRMEEFLEDILKANEPTVQPEKVSERLQAILGWTFEDSSGEKESLLTREEYKLLTIPQGSLDEGERREIESHVEHSFRILSQIPWTKELQRVPDIARAHHEKLDGSGYPYSMTEKEIPLQAKVMTICDIFDALTAGDRPYKKALPVDRALEIIGQEAQSHLLDRGLFQIFLEARIFKMTRRD